MSKIFVLKDNRVSNLIPKDMKILVKKKKKETFFLWFKYIF